MSLSRCSGIHGPAPQESGRGWLVPGSPNPRVGPASGDADARKAGLTGNIDAICKFQVALRMKRPGARCLSCSREESFVSN